MWLQNLVSNITPERKNMLQRFTKCSDKTAEEEYVYVFLN